ncbi:hypothetical protein IH979_02690 [Patescibacteria group bacterium]|nr:hypothetical protein [Patescibacteria group bacterium]
MKWSPILHGIAAISGVLGALSLIGAWIAGSAGTFLGFSQAHLFEDAQSLLLVSIAFGVGTIIHQRLEKK